MKLPPVRSPYGSLLELTAELPIGAGGTEVEEATPDTSKRSALRQPAGVHAVGLL